MEQAKPPCVSGRYWRVGAGDTFYTIAEEVGTTADELVNLNPGVDPFNLQVGQFLCLPAELPPCASGIFFVVGPGETLYLIAQTTGTTVEALLAVNPGIDPFNLRVGQKICLP